MAEKNTNFQEKQSLGEWLWLAYFNSYLYEKGIITESERNRMITKIESRKGVRQQQQIDAFDTLEAKNRPLYKACREVIFLIIMPQSHWN